MCSCRISSLSVLLAMLLQCTLSHAALMSTGSGTASGSIQEARSPATGAATSTIAALWQQLQHQRLHRFTSLMQELLPLVPAGAAAVAAAAAAKPASSALHAKLNWYAANQRPQFAAKDMQLMLQANSFAAAAAASSTADQSHLASGQLELITLLQRLSPKLAQQQHGKTDSIAAVSSGSSSSTRTATLAVATISTGRSSTTTAAVSVGRQGVEDGRLMYVGSSLVDFGSAAGGSSATMIGLDSEHPLLLHTLADADDRLEYDYLNSYAMDGKMQQELSAAAAAPEAAAAAELHSADIIDDDQQLDLLLSRKELPVVSKHRRLMSVGSDSSSVSLSGASGSTRFVSNSFFGDSSSSSSSNGPAAAVTAANSASQGAEALKPLSSQQQRPQQDYRIIGGVEAPKDRYTWVCSLRGNNDFHYCGCSLIAPSVVLTAGHCLDHTDPALSTPWVEIGRYFLNGANNTDGNSYDRIKCSKSIVNPGWSFNTGLNDIALCLLDGESRFTPVTLAEEGSSLKVGTKLTVMGWGAQAEGATNAPQLMKVNVDLTSTASCNITYNNAIKDTQICAGLPDGGADACQGDSGGPLIVEGVNAAQDTQVGIVSYGVGCGRPNTPGVYTDISKYRGYIRTQLLANGVAYEPLTGKSVTSRPSVLASQAPAPTTANTATITRPTTTTTTTTGSSSSGSSTDPCACSVDGASGSTQTGLIGCKQHGLDFGDKSFYCYTQGGTKCAAATASRAHPGAAWLDCNPVLEVKGSGAADATTATVKPSSDSENNTTGSDGIAGLFSGNPLAAAVQALQGWINFNAASVNPGNSSTASAGSTEVRPRAANWP